MLLLSINNMPAWFMYLLLAILLITIFMIGCLIYILGVLIYRGILWLYKSIPKKVQ